MITDISMKFPASVFSMNFCGSGGTSEKLGAVKLISLVPARIGGIRDSVLVGVESRHCPVTATC